MGEFFFFKFKDPFLEFKDREFNGGGEDSYCKSLRSCSRILEVLKMVVQTYSRLEKLVSGEGLIRIMAIRDNELCPVSLKFFFRYD